MVSRSEDSIKVTCSVQHTHRLIASQHSWHTTFFLMIMKHLQTLAVVMMTTAMVLAAPLYSTEGPNGTINENDFLKEQIYREAKRMRDNTSVRKQVGSGGNCQFV